MSVRMELNKIIINEAQDVQIIVLKEVDGERAFPILIGNPEAIAIDRRLKGIPAPRPMTHDLLANVIKSLGADLESIEITNLHSTTYFAKLNLLQNGKKIAIDSRPSDAIALGISTNVQILVADHVIEQAMK